MNVEQCWYLVHYNFEAELNVRELGYNECSCNLSRAPIMSVGSQPQALYNDHYFVETVIGYRIPHRLRH